VYTRSGNYGQPGFPYTPGTDGAGVVSKVGATVTKFKVGDKVIVYRTKGKTGTYSEYCVSEENDLSTLPSNLSFQQGAAIGIPYLTAYVALFNHAQAKTGERILVHGATGGVGIAAVQIAKASGMFVIATAGTEAGKELLLKEGADLVLNHKEKDYLKQAGEINVCLEMLANINLQADLEAIAADGRIVIIGSRGPIQILPVLFMAKQVKVTGILLSSTPEPIYQDAIKKTVELLSSGKLNPIIGPGFKLADANKSHVEVMEHASGSSGKVVLNILD